MKKKIVKLKNKKGGYIKKYLLVAGKRCQGVLCRKNSPMKFWKGGDKGGENEATNRGFRSNWAKAFN